MKYYLIKNIYTNGSGSFPTKLLEIYPSLNFKPFYKEDMDKKDKKKNIENILKTQLMVKTEFNYDNLKDISISDMKKFLDENNLLTKDLENKSKKGLFIEYIKNNLNEIEFSKKFFEFKKKNRLSEASEAPIKIKNLKWGPPLNCECEIINIENKIEKVYQINIKNDKIIHENCHWIYHRNNFCSHIIALILSLSKIDYPRTSDFIERYTNSS